MTPARDSGRHRRRREILGDTGAGASTWATTPARGRVGETPARLGRSDRSPTPRGCQREVLGDAGDAQGPGRRHRREVLEANPWLGLVVVVDQWSKEGMTDLCVETLSEYHGIDIKTFVSEDEGFQFITN